MMANRAERRKRVNAWKCDLCGFIMCCIHYGGQHVGDVGMSNE